MDSPPPQMPAVPPPPPAAIRRNRTPIIVVAVVVALIAVAAAVAAIAGGGNDGSSASSPSGTTGATALPSTAAVPPAPQSLKAHATPFAVSLRWAPGEGSGATDGYTVYRNDKVLYVVTGTGTTYTDKTALPESKYDYEVEAYAPGGTVVSALRASVHVHTPTAPAATSRLTGIFDVHLHLTSSYGISSVGDTTAGWRFKPKCGDGPCNVQMVDIHHTLPPVLLTRKGATYEGSGSAQLLTCSGTKITSTFHIMVHVTDASTSSNEWRASRLEGTFTTSAPSELGCVSAGTNYAVSAKSIHASGQSL